MRVIKGLVLFCFSVVAVSACFEAPEMSVIPKITFRKLEFKAVGTIADYDTLILTMDFQDGDGNLGLRPDVPADSEKPFHIDYYFVGTASGDTIPIIPSKLLTYNVITSSDVQGVSGKIVTANTRTQDPLLFGFLPSPDFTRCISVDKNYTKTEILVQSTLNLVNDATHNITDTLYEVRSKSTGDINLVGTVNTQNEIATGRVFYVLNDPLLYRPNPNHYNIEIKFYRFISGNYVEYDFFSQHCITYNGRFPYIGSAHSGTGAEGVIRYAMASTSFISIFGSERWRISIRIRDRALNSSNVEIYNFELDDITLNR